MKLNGKSLLRFVFRGVPVLEKKGPKSMKSVTAHSTKAYISTGKLKRRSCQNGSVLVLVVIAMVILMALGLGMLNVSYGLRHEAARLKSEAVATLAAEAGYEKAIFWMSQQGDMLSALQNEASGASGSLNFVDGGCDYTINLFTFSKARPIYRVASSGHSGVFTKKVEVLVIQAISGWDMGMCRVPLGANQTYPVNFAGGEIIDMPVQINNLHDIPDDRDIYISGSPQFIREVSMGESRYRSAGLDKYSGVMSFFDGGIYFNQPDSRITDEATVQSKIDRFRRSTNASFDFTPVGNAVFTNPNAAAVPAVQLEFYVDDSGIGQVRITNNCTVRGFQQQSNNRTLDFKINKGSGPDYTRYDIYGYHVMPDDAEATGQRFTRRIDETYVTQSIGGIESEPGGQIFVDGNVIIGGDNTRHNGDQVIKGKITVVATGNIWVADSVVVDGERDADGKPSEDNPNILGLIAQGVVKVVDPGMSDYDYVDDSPEEPAGFEYVPIGRPDDPLLPQGDPNYHKRHLSDSVEVEAAITVGGGGWGAENVSWRGYGGRKEASGSQDFLVVRGTITEAIRGVVGLVGRDGFLKRYYLDERLLEGVLPGDFWLRGKYIPAPAGWHDYR